MNEPKAFITADFAMGGLSIVFVTEQHDGMRLLSNGRDNWFYRPGDAVQSDVEPLRLPEDYGRALLAGLLRHYNGADDARMLRKDYDAERARVDLLIEKLGMPIVITGGEVIGR